MKYLKEVTVPWHDYLFYTKQTSYAYVSALSACVLIIELDVIYNQKRDTVMAFLKSLQGCGYDFF